MRIDQQWRRMNARLHSAGHLLDVAMQRAGKRDLAPDKGYHFQAGPYVQYVGTVAADERDGLLKELNKHCKDIIEEASKTKSKVLELYSYTVREVW